PPAVAQVHAVPGLDSLLLPARLALLLDLAEGQPARQRLVDHRLSVLRRRTHERARGLHREQVLLDLQDGDLSVRPLILARVPVEELAPAPRVLGPFLA